MLLFFGEKHTHLAPETKAYTHLVPETTVSRAKCMIVHNFRSTRQ